MKGLVMQLVKKRPKSPIPAELQRFVHKSPRPLSPAYDNEFVTDDNEQDKTQVIKFPDSHISIASRTVN